jgi:tetratricopeptide (TPR) repeat protein
MRLLISDYAKCRLVRPGLAFFLTVILTIPSLHAIGQKLDSLKAVLKDARGAARCAPLCEIAYELLDVDDSAALQYARQSLECTRLYRDTLHMIKAGRMKAVAFSRLGERDSAEATSELILSIARKKQCYNEMHFLIQNLALSLTHKGEYDDALKYNFEALEIRRRIGAGPLYIASTLNNIGFVYYKLKDYDKAADYYSAALKECVNVPGNNRQIETTVVNLSLCYAYTDEFEKADSLIVVAQGRCKNKCLQMNVVDMAFCRGVIALGRRDTAAAKIRFLESYELARKSSEERLQLDNIIYLSRLYLATDEISTAERYLELAEALIRNGVSYNLELMKVYREFAQFYERKGDYKRTIEFQRRHLALRDSTQNEEMTIALMRVEANHVEREKNARIKVQNETLSLNAEVISRQRIAAIFAFSTIVLLAGFVVLLVLNVREKRSRNADLEKRVKSRTAELESIVRQSQLSLTERKMWIEKILSSVRERTNTVHGLSKLVKKDPESSENCAKLIEQEMTRLWTEVNGYGLRSDSGPVGVRTSVLDVK